MDVNLDALDDIIIQVLMKIRSLPERLDNYSNVKDDLDTLNQLLLLIGETVFKVGEQRQNPHVRPLLASINKELNDLLVWMERPPFDQGGKLPKRKCLVFWTNPTKNHISSLRARIGRMVHSLKDIASIAPPAAMLTNSSDGSGKLKNDGEASKHKLTPSQKICLSYCSLFPKNYVFQVGDLINLWMAEGFLVSQRPEEIGRRYISEFLDMSKFQPMEVDECGFLRALKMDPQIYDQAKSGRFDDSITVVDPDESRDYKGIHVVSFHYSLDLSCGTGIPKSLFDEAKYLKTILLAPKITQSRVPDTKKMERSTCEAVFSNFKTLRLLDLHNLGIKEVPPTISGLTDLRYLNLSENDMTHLPSSITKLRNLQTLILSGCRKLKELPKKLHALGNLRHLDIEGCQNLTGVPATIGKLTSFVTLSHYVVGKSSSSIQKLTGLNNLSGNLEILHLERVKDTKARRLLREKKYLDALALRWDHTDDNNRVQLHANDMNSLRLLQPHTNLRVLTVTGYKGESFPDWILSLENLVKFELDNCTTCKSLPPLHRLPSLNILRLQSLDSLECINTSVGNEELTTEKEELFSGISKLEIRSCPKLITMPLYPRLDGKLVLVGSSLKPLLKTTKYWNFRTTVSQPPLSELKSMLIENIEENFPQESKVFQSFTSLEELEIRECHHFRSLPKGFEHLASLKSLTIEKCRKLASLPEEFKFLTSLQRLTIRSCKELKSVPCIIGKLSSLEEFEISGCPNLTLPEESNHLPLDLKALGWPLISGIKEVVKPQGSFGSRRT